jgi:hypothetical protein
MNTLNRFTTSQLAVYERRLSHLWMLPIVIRWRFGSECEMKCFFESFLNCYIMAKGKKRGKEKNLRLNFQSHSHSLLALKCKILTAFHPFSFGISSIAHKKSNKKKDEGTKKFLSRNATATKKRKKLFHFITLLKSILLLVVS